MKNKIKLTLAMLLTAIMILSALPASIAFAGVDNDKLIDLDFSSFTSSQSTVNGKVRTTWNGTNNGTLNTNANVTMYYEKNSGMSIDKDVFVNVDGERVYYMRKNADKNASAQNNNNCFVDKKDLDSGTFAISFWAKFTPQTDADMTNIFDYNVNGTQLLSLNQKKTESGKYVLVDQNGNSLGNRCPEVSAGEWVHYALTFREYQDMGVKVDASGKEYESYKRICILYVNGTQIKYYPFEKPRHYVTTTKLAIGGEAVRSNTSTSSMPAEISFADFTVYDGIIALGAPSELYAAEKSRFELMDPQPVIIDDGDLMIDLDMSTYSKDRESNPDLVSGSIGKIKNNGLFNKTTIVKMSAQKDRWNALDLTRERFQNSTYTNTSYLHRTINTPVCNDANRFNTIEEPALEEMTNTITFWAKYVPVSRYGCHYNLFEYSLTYDDDTKQGAFALNQKSTNKGDFLLTGYSQSKEIANLTNTAACEWAQYTLVNYPSNGSSKSMVIYVNGKRIKSLTNSIESKPVKSATIAFGGFAVKADWFFWPKDFYLGDVKVYKGKMTDDEILNLYNEELPKYSTKVKEIHGYSIAPEIHEVCDGKIHKVAVDVAEDSTKGVHIRYENAKGYEFTGASKAGSHDVKIIITKEDYETLELQTKLVLEGSNEIEHISDTETLLDLDMSTYEKDTSSTDPDSVITSIGGLVNNGTWGDAPVIKMSSQSGRWTNLDLSKYMRNIGADRHEAYLRRTINTYACNDANRFNTIEYKEFETGSNTITFWAKYTPISSSGCKYNLFDYSIEPSVGHAQGVFSLNQKTTYNGKFILVDKDDSRIFKDITDIAAGKWAHYTVVNSEAVNGKKEMKVYVNGIYLGSQTVSVPDGKVKSAKIAFGGYAVRDAYCFWPRDISIGDIKVYDGELSKEAILEDFAEKSCYYIADEEEIVGYSIDQEITIPYDGENHMVAVSVDNDATEGVDISYICDGSEFTGATEIGTYPITVYISKDGYNTLEIPVTLSIIATKYIDLDMSTYEKDLLWYPYNYQGSIGNIKNNGMWADTTLVKMSSEEMLDSDIHIDLSLENAPAPCLHRTVDTKTCNLGNQYTVIEEKQLEEQANTITYWAKYVSDNRAMTEYNLLDYNVKYDGESEEKHLFTIDQSPTTESVYRLVDRLQAAVYGNATDKLNNKWAQITITNPEYDENGQKTMKVYINGRYSFEKTVTKPEGDVENVRLAFAGEALENSRYIFWPSDFYLGKVTVSEGVLSSKEILSEYNSTKKGYINN
ncbi:MAG: hypothetical protein J5590_09820 [Clostridia bacterium]|nr:hypothetical protein [Clostridia bacterium]